MPDVRWKQRFNNYRKAFQLLAEAVELARARELSKLEEQGMIQSFEFTHELAWNLLKDYLEEQGFVDIIGSKNATREAFKNGLISDGETWMEMIRARNQTSHTYNQAIAKMVVDDVVHRFFPAFEQLAKKFTTLYAQEDGTA